MTYPDQPHFPDGDPWTPEFLDEQLDQLLGEDVDPNLSMEAKRAIVLRVRAEEDAALDRLLDLDGVGLAGVEIPVGLAGRVMGALDSHLGSRTPDVLVPQLAPSAPSGSQRRRRLYLVGGAFAAAAAVAALVIVLKKGQAGEVAPYGGDGVPFVANADVGFDGAPSDEFLALLPTLENVDFLIDELDPLEADALFLFETEDDLLLDLLDENG